MISNIVDFDFGGKVFVFSGREVLLHADGSELSVCDIALLKDSAHCVDVLTEDAEYCVMYFDSFDDLEDAYQSMPLRIYADKLGEDRSVLMMRAKGVIEWHRRNRYCPNCGKQMTFHDSLTAMTCSDCGNLVFPRIDPCIIVLVRRGKRMLLARHVQRNQDIYACIAGFMETGENAEHAVAREIYEETGIRVKNIQYFGTQSWPYPSQLMIAFTADYESGELSLQEEELSDAGWFDEDNCPASPQPGSIAYRLIHNINK